MVAVSDGYFGTASSIPIHLDNVLCSGTEESLFSCSSPPVGTHNCDHTEDAGLICGGICDQEPISAAKERPTTKNSDVLNRNFDLSVIDHIGQLLH